MAKLNNFLFIFIFLTACSVNHKGAQSIELALSSYSAITVINSNANANKLIDISSLITKNNGTITYSLIGPGSLTSDGIYSPPTSGSATTATVIVTDITPSQKNVVITINDVLSTSQSSVTTLTNTSQKLESFFQNGKAPYTYTTTSGSTIGASTSEFSTSTAAVYTVTATDSFGDNTTLTVTAVDPTLDLQFSTYTFDSGGTHIGLQHSRADASTIATYFDTNGVLQTVAANGDLRFTYDPTQCANPTDSFPTCTTTPTGRKPLGALVEKSSTNLLLRSQEIDNAAWTTSNLTTSSNSGVVTDPSGTNLAEKIIEDSSNSTHNIYQDANISANTIYTLSAFIQAGERTAGRLTLCDTSCTDAIINDFNLTTESVTTSTSGSASAAQAQLQNLGNNWFRVIVSGKINAASTTARSMISLKDAGLSLSYLGDNSSGFYVYGTQLEEGGFATSYIATTGSTTVRAADIASFKTAIAGGQDITFTRDHRLDPSGANSSTSTPIASYTGPYGTLNFAQKDELRLNYSPMTCSDGTSSKTTGNKNCLRKLNGLLVEESRTNLIDESINLISWTPSGPLTVSDGNIFGPDQQTNATLLNKTGATVASFLTSQSIANDSQSYIASVFIKKVTSAPSHFPYLKICLTGGTMVCGELHLNNYDGTIASAGSLLDTGVIEYSDYYRIWLKIANNSSGNTNLNFDINPAASQTLGTTITITMGSNYFWGAQLEAGDFLTTYIKTNGSEVRRLADSATVSNLSGWFDASKGTLLSKFQLDQTTYSGRTYCAASINDGTANESIFIGTESNADNFLAAITDASTTQFSQQYSSLNTNENTVALTYQVNDFQSAKNNTLGTADNSGSLPAPSQLQIGSQVSGSQINGHIQRIIFSDNRIDNLSVQSLTNQ